jgi:hypothetical protein
MESEMIMNWLWGKACPSFAKEVHGFHGFSDCPYCFKINMDVRTRPLSFSDYLVMDFGIHILFKNIYSMRMADLCIFEVLCEQIGIVTRVCIALFE